MGRMKDFAMDVSTEMGYDGEINEEVMAEAHRRLEAFDEYPTPGDIEDRPVDD